MSEILPEGTKCPNCGYKLDEEERESPRLSWDNEPICDDCYQEEYQYRCCNCEEHYDQDEDGQDVQHNMIVVFSPTVSSYGEKVLPGVYRVTGGPYWSTDYFSSCLHSYNLKWLCKLTESFQKEDPFYPVGHLCTDCQQEMEKRGVLELTKKCALAFC